MWEDKAFTSGMCSYADMGKWTGSFSFVLFLSCGSFQLKKGQEQPF